MNVDMNTCFPISKRTDTANAWPMLICQLCGAVVPDGQISLNAAHRHVVFHQSLNEKNLTI